MKDWGLRIYNRSSGPPTVDFCDFILFSASPPLGQPASVLVPGDWSRDLGSWTVLVSLYCVSSHLHSLWGVGDPLPFYSSSLGAGVEYKA